jgi:hypothetical protein
VPRSWKPSIYNGDWLGPALLTQLAGLSFLALLSFTGTKVQILTQKALAVSSGNAWGDGMLRALNSRREGEGPVFRASTSILALYLPVVFLGRCMFANFFLAVLAQDTSTKVQILQLLLVQKYKY